MMILLVFGMMMSSCVAFLCILLLMAKNGKRSGAPPTSSTQSTTTIAPPVNNAPDIKGQLVSSSISQVQGLVKNGPRKDMYSDSIKVTARAPSTALALRTQNRLYTRGDGKKMMAVSVNDAWPAVRKYFGLAEWQKTRFLALMLGQSTRESTLCIDVETGTAKGWGVDSAHAYGFLQTAVTAFAGANPKFDQEDDVPEMKRYAWSAENFLNPMISNFMGIRKMCHFAIQAKTKYAQTDPWVIMRLALQAHNTGHAKPGENFKYLCDYPDMCARMAEFYFKGHLSDEPHTWYENFSGNSTSYTKPTSGTGWRANWAWFWNR